MIAEAIAQYTTPMRVKVQYLLQNMNQHVIGATALAYMFGYASMLERLERVINDIPDARKAPILVQQLIAHMRLHMKDHIRVGEHLFDPDVAGGDDAYRRWQEDGYPMVRIEENFEERMAIFQAIYTQQPTYYRREVDTDHVMKGHKDYASFGFRRYYFDPRAFGITYKKVVDERFAQYAPARAFDEAPYWGIVNYGSDFAEESGSTLVGRYSGAHYIEIGEDLLPTYLSIAREVYYEYVREYLQQDEVLPYLTFIHQRGLQRAGRLFNLPYLNTVITVPVLEYISSRG